MLLAKEPKQLRNTQVQSDCLEQTTKTAILIATHHKIIMPGKLISEKLDEILILVVVERGCKDRAPEK